MNASPHRPPRPARARARVRAAASRPTFRASRSRSSRANSVSTARDIVKLASNENPRGPSPRGARGDRGRDRRADALSRRQRLRAQGRAGRALRRRRRRRSCSATARNDILELVDAGVPAARATRAVYSQHAFAVYPLATQARGAHGIEVPARDLGHDLRGDARGDHAATRASCSSPIRTIPTGTWIAPAALEAFVASVPRDVAGRARRGVQRVPRAGASRADSVGVDRALPEPRRLADVLEGVRARGAAHRLRRHARGGRRHAEPRAAAVQRQCARAGRRASPRSPTPRYVDESRAINRAGCAQLEAGLRGARRSPTCRRTRNFLLVEVGDAAAVYRALLQQGVIVRPVGELRPAASACASRSACRPRTSASSPRSRAALAR